MPDASQGDVAVLVPAAGQGTRMGGQRKQFRTLGGASLLVQTLRVFDQHPEVASIMVAVPVQERDDVGAQLASAGLTIPVQVVEGGESRQASVGNALKAAPAAASIVLVHDAVRPFLAQSSISDLIAEVRVSGAAALAAPLADTLREGEKGQFAATRSREGLFRMFTPQGCRRDWFEAAHLKAQEEGYVATDDVDLMQRAGYAVKIVEGSPLNMKITTPEDWALAQWLWPHWRNPET